jgi:hypothetical protein
MPPSTAGEMPAATFSGGVKKLPCVAPSAESSCQEVSLRG